MKIAILLCTVATHHLSAPAVRARQSDPIVHSDLEMQIIAAERAGLDALKTGNLDAFAKSTADEAVFVDSQGAASKATVMKNVAGFKLTDYTMEDMKFVKLSTSSGLISYKIMEMGSSHGHDFTAKAFVSSVWAKRGRNWVCLFSQETGTK